MKTLLLSLFLLINAYSSNDRLVNTNWVSKVSNKYSESFNFRQNKYVVHYCRTSERTYHGCYNISKDTLIIKERDNSNSNKVTYHRIKFLLKEDILYPVSCEDLSEHKWEKSKAQLEKSSIFKRI